MSAICRTFSGNTWRSDLCSNCFKSQDEHRPPAETPATMATAHRYVTQAPALYQSRGLSLQWRMGGEPLYDRISRRDFASQTAPKNIQQPAGDQQQKLQVEENSSSKGILVRTQEKKKLRRGSSVEFASEEAMVIGYGGNDYDSDTSPWEMGSDDGSLDLDLLDDTDDDRKISKLTKNNTEFNSSNDNLLKKEEEDAARRQKSLNDINNSKNLNQKQSTERALGILFKDSPTEKKLGQYYFSTSMGSLSCNKSETAKLPMDVKESSESPKSHVQERKELQTADLKQREDSAQIQQSQKSDNINVKKQKNNMDNCHFAKPINIYSHNDNVKAHKERSLITEPMKSFLHNNNTDVQKENNNNNLKLDNSKSRDIERMNVSDQNSSKLLQNDFTPLNTRTYSYVSELNKNSISSEHGSDSDYSTSRLTAGESTDSESFPEEARVIPCASFLHGNFPRATIDSLDSDKKYDGGSSTSGDVSNLSDDSDALEPNDRTIYKSRNVRISKTSPVADNLKSKDAGGVDFITITEKESPKYSKSKNAPVAPKGKVTFTNSSSGDESMSSRVPKSQNLSVVQLSEAPKKTENMTPPMVSNQTHRDKHPETVCISVKSERALPDLCRSADTSPACNIITVNRPSQEQLHLKSSNRTSVSSVEKSLEVKTNSPPREVHFTEPDRSSDGIYQDTSRSHPNSSDSETDYERSPEAIHDRQTKLAALALELGLARRDSKAINRLSTFQTPPVPPPEVKAKFTPQNLGPEHPYPVIKKTSALTSRLYNTLPDVLLETPSPAKVKKSRFSLKKLLKRNKESATFTPTSKEVNPKAWKKQSFDRSRLSLEIVHPMDLLGDEGAETIQYRQLDAGRGERARSMSHLPLMADVSSPGGQNNARKAGTVAERKKNRPALVRTPSCSALPNRPASRSQAPPKPPPPPKFKVSQAPPPPPPHQPRNLTTPPRPPPPKVPEGKPRTLSYDKSPQDSCELETFDKEYANLGEIRSLLTPAKPTRPSAPSAPPRGAETREEEDHYTYLDEVKLSPNRSSVEPSKPAIEKAIDPSSSVWPWLDLQTSYTAIAAASYESLAEIIAVSINESVEYFKSSSNFKWADFVLEAEQPHYLSQRRWSHDAVHKDRPQDALTLLVLDDLTPRKRSPSQTARNATRFPVLATFTDRLVLDTPYSQTTTVYVLKRSTVTSITQFVQNSSCFQSDQHIHLQNYCFVLLQLIHSLKSLQAEGIEELNYNLEHLLLVSPLEDMPPVLVLLPADTHGDSQHKGTTLCQAVLNTLKHFLKVEYASDLSSCLINGAPLSQPVAHTFTAISNVLSEEKASSLSQAKGLLEYMLWGPVDVPKESHSGQSLDVVLGRWLDLQRAQMVKSAITALQKKGQCLHVYEEYQLSFLLQSSVASLKSVMAKL